MEQYLFFNSTETDKREYDSADFASYFGAVITSGLITTGIYKGDLTVTKSNTFMEVLVDSGQALLEGHMYLNTSQMPLAVPPVSTNGMIRYDALVIRMDRVNRTITAQIIKGTESTVDATALAAFPQPLRSSQVYDLTLARIQTKITGITITDLRLDEQYCGLAAGLIKPPTKDLQDLKDQIAADLQTFVDQVEAEWQAWFDSIQSGTFITKSEFDTGIDNIVSGPISDLQDEQTATNENMAKISRELATMQTLPFKKFMRDPNGIYQSVDYYWLGTGTQALYARSILQGGTSPLYSERVVYFYNKDPNRGYRSVTFKLFYDTDGTLLEQRFSQEDFYQ